MTDIPFNEPVDMTGTAWMGAIDGLFDRRQEDEFDPNDPLYRAVRCLAMHWAAERDDPLEEHLVTAMRSVVELLLSIDEADSSLAGGAVVAGSVVASLDQARASLGGSLDSFKRELAA